MGLIDSAARNESPSTRIPLPTNFKRSAFRALVDELATRSASDEMINASDFAKIVMSHWPTEEFVLESVQVSNSSETPSDSVLSDSEEQPVAPAEDPVEKLAFLLTLNIPDSSPLKEYYDDLMEESEKKDIELAERLIALFVACGGRHAAHVVTKAQMEMLEKGGIVFRPREKGLYILSRTDMEHMDVEQRSVSMILYFLDRGNK